MTALGVLVGFGVKKYYLAEDDDCPHYKKGYIFFDFHVFRPKRINKKRSNVMETWETLQWWCGLVI